MMSFKKSTVARAFQCKPDVDEGGESVAIGKPETPRGGKVGGEEMETSGQWVLFVCLFVSLTPA